MTNEDPATAIETQEAEVATASKPATVSSPHPATHPLHQLQMEIAALPAVDHERVNAVLEKLQTGKLEILGTDAQQQASAARIAQKIVDESSV